MDVYKRIPKKMKDITTAKAIDEIEKAYRTNWTTGEIDKYIYSYLRLIKTNATLNDKKAKDYCEWNGIY